ncbi:hypothetical protein A33Q_1245 [Indibacter alkaliphilus LW1]|uniref:HEAT repeat-containing protein n=1 Tax=Indibacter alkaliphilus (strain CCUG 57479 / KCTC 22604 / LW1) TaxID=1189612 RepID=S2E2A5_INDAL|nr:HEAT repeat domain-containing protein [Indibacter alkaliphilus]EOZ98591.1 hypothetical protein A33Q_1245 [Indibacter alkaliphilus LW1]
MENKIEDYISRMCDPTEKDAYIFADKLAKIGDEAVIQRLIEILKSDDHENAQLAAMALSKIKNNFTALEPMLEVIHKKENKLSNGVFVQSLEGFDLSGKFIDLFRIYLFGNFKSSALAKEMLDTVEFELTPRVLKKMEKHWNHFQNNTDTNSNEFEIKKMEVEEMFEEIKEIFSEDSTTNEL